MAYEKQGFYSGDPLMADQLNTMEDGIIVAQDIAGNAEAIATNAEAVANGIAAVANNAETVAIEARDSVRNLGGEYEAFEPITWDGVVGDKEVADVSVIMPGASLVKISDTVLTYEELLDSIAVLNDGSQEQITADYMVSKEEGDAMGGYGMNTPVISVFNPELVQTSLGIVLSEGVYFFYVPGQSIYVTSLSKTIVKKIDEKFLPDFSSGANMEEGTGEGATQQHPNLGKMNTQDDVLGFNVTSEKNPFVNGFHPYGATGPYSATLNGRSTAQGEYSLSANSQTAALGDYATALGYATVAGGDCSLAGGSGTYTAADGTVALGMRTKATAPYAISTGSDTEALADCAITGGIETVAKGMYSVALGKGTLASYAWQTVIGAYNKVDETILDEKGKPTAIHTLFTVGSGMNHETYGILRDDAFRVLDNRAIIFFPIKADEQDIDAEPICLQDVITIVGQTITGLQDSIDNLSITDDGFQTQINDIQAEIQRISGIITGLQDKVAALENK